MARRSVDGDGVRPDIDDAPAHGKSGRVVRRCARVGPAEHVTAVRQRRDRGVELVAGRDPGQRRIPLRGNRRKHREATGAGEHLRIEHGGVDIAAAGIDRVGAGESGPRHDELAVRPHRHRDVAIDSGIAVDMWWRATKSPSEFPSLSWTRPRIRFGLPPPSLYQSTTNLPPRAARPPRAASPLRDKRVGAEVVQERGVRIRAELAEGHAAETEGDLRSVLPNGDEAAVVERRYVGIGLRPCGVAGQDGMVRVGVAVTRDEDTSRGCWDRWWQRGCSNW